MRDIGLLRAKNGYFLLTLALWCCYLDYMNYLQWEDLVEYFQKYFPELFPELFHYKIDKTIESTFSSNFQSR